MTIMATSDDPCMISRRQKIDKKVAKKELKYTIVGFSIIFAIPIIAALIIYFIQ
jgi:hypothetical protein